MTDEELAELDELVHKKSRELNDSDFAWWLQNNTTFPQLKELRRYRKEKREQNK